MNVIEQSLGGRLQSFFVSFILAAYLLCHRNWFLLFSHSLSIPSTAIKYHRNGGLWCCIPVAWDSTSQASPWSGRPPPSWRRTPWAGKSERDGCGGKTGQKEAGDSETDRRPGYSWAMNLHEKNDNSRWTSSDWRPLPSSSRYMRIFVFVACSHSAGRMRWRRRGLNSRDQNFVTVLTSPLALAQWIKASLTGAGMCLWHQARPARLWMRGTCLGGGKRDKLSPPVAHISVSS